MIKKNFVSAVLIFCFSGTLVAYAASPDRPFSPAPWMAVTGSNVETPSKLSGAEQDQCIGVLLGELNTRMGTSFRRDDVAPVQMSGWDHPEIGFLKGGGFNIRIVAHVSQSDADKVQAKRYADGETWLKLGAQASLHVPGDGWLAGTNPMIKTPNPDGTVTVDFVSHTDDGYAYLPVGLVVHFFDDILGASDRPPCPIEPDVHEEED